MQLSFLMKYRCRRLDELYTEHTPKLRAMVASKYGRFMLLGEPGTGKTTIVDVLLNELYAGADRRDCILRISTLLDQGIQFFRSDVKTFCQTCPHGAQKTVVLDDMDTLSESGQRVFLNYMDLYPTVHFIASATSASKLVDGLDSRLILFKLTPFSESYLRSEIERVATLETIPYDPAALDLLVEHCGGSMRTLLNTLEKVGLLGGASLETVAANCINIDARSLHAFTECVDRGDELAAMDLLYAVHESGFSVMDILDTYFAFIKVAAIEETRKYAMLKIIAKYITIFNTVHEHGIELLFFVHDLCIGPETWV